jgi:hypothetical protein
MLAFARNRLILCSTAARSARPDASHAAQAKGRPVLSWEAMMESYKTFAAKGIKSGSDIEDLEWFIIAGPFKGLNGYIVFPKRLTIETGYNGLLEYIPVHGGITFAHEYEDGMVYGFDTAHYDSEEKPHDNAEWIKGQISIMARGVKLAAELEPQYLLARTNEEKQPICQKIIDLNPDDWKNFGVMVNILSGEL